MSKVLTDKTAFNAPLTIVDRLEKFKSVFDNTRRAYSIGLHETRLDLEYYPKNPNVLVVFLAGAKPRDRDVTPPFFLGRKLASSTDASCLFISDPAFYLTDELRLAWYGGTSNDPMNAVLPDIIQFVASTIGASRTMFFGGSGGGFASLVLASQIENSLALVWNPQIKLESYLPRIIAAYSSIAWRCQVEELSERMITNVASIYANKKASNSLVAYMQNITDHHVKNHLTPFLAEIGSPCPRKLTSRWMSQDVYLHLTDWREGHKPPPYCALARVLSEFSNPERPWMPSHFASVFSAAERDVAEQDVVPVSKS